MGKDQFLHTNGLQLTLARMTEDFVIKYFWSAIGYGLMSIPIFFPAIGNSINQDTGASADPVAARAEGQL